MHWTSAQLGILCHLLNRSLVCVGCSSVASLSRDVTINQKATLHFSMSIQNLSLVTHLATSSALISAWSL
jgi:hypothetical protein